MFQFPGLAFVPYVFRNKYLLRDLYKFEDVTVVQTQPSKEDLFEDEGCAPASSKL